MSELQFTRRQTVAALAASAAMPLIAKATPAFAQARQRLTEAQVSAVLQSFAENLLQLSPEQATSLGIDKGARAPLRTGVDDHGEQAVRSLRTKGLGTHRRGSHSASYRSASAPRLTGPWCRRWCRCCPRRR